MQLLDFGSVLVIYGEVLDLSALGVYGLDCINFQYGVFRLFCWKVSLGFIIAGCTWTASASTSRAAEIAKEVYAPRD